MTVRNTSNTIRVSEACVIAVRLFDIAYAIDLAKIESLWRSSSPSNLRARLMSTPKKAVKFEAPPLVLPLNSIRLTLQNQIIEATVSARLYDFGVVAFSLCIPADNLSWSEYCALVNDVDRTIGYDAPRGVWTNLLSELRERFEPALVRPNTSKLEEDYIIANVRQFNVPLTAISLQAEFDLIPILSGERNTLSEQARNDLLSQRHSYYTDDLVVMTWDRAFVYEPRGDSDVIEVLEMANAQSLELHYYNQLLDTELPRMHALVKETSVSGRRSGPRRFARLARKLYSLVAEVSEVTEKVENALQVTQDVYLARIYTTALQLLRIPIVTSAVDRKLATIRDTYSALYEEASASRALVLEISIVILIMLEIVMALSGIH
jgi:hypothetical protein